MKNIDFSRKNFKNILFLFNKGSKIIKIPMRLYVLFTIYRVNYIPKWPILRSVIDNWRMFTDHNDMTPLYFSGDDYYMFFFVILGWKINIIVLVYRIYLVE